MVGTWYASKIINPKVKSQPKLNPHTKLGGPMAFNTLIKPNIPSARVNILSDHVHLGPTGGPYHGVQSDPSGLYYWGHMRVLKLFNQWRHDHMTTNSQTRHFSICIFFILQFPQPNKK